MNDEWVPIADIPRPGGWQRIAEKLGIVATPELLIRVAHRRQQRRSEGLVRQARFDEPLPPPTPDIWRLIDKVDDLIDVINRRRVIAEPPKPKPSPDPRPAPPRQSVKRPVWTDTP